VILLTQKKCKGFFSTSGRLGEIQPLNISSAARSKTRPLAACAISNFLRRAPSDLGTPLSSTGCETYPNNTEHEDVPRYRKSNTVCRHW